ncbi:MAG TPA: dephospho-CoA kinase [Abditibacteriaceae bacterium]|jgi:dephospho-CoA kinase
MILLGLTGDIAAGKSTVAKLLQGRGAVVIDSDDLVRELYADRDFAQQVATLFETHFWDAKAGAVRPILTPEGGIDRQALAALVFRDAAALRKLELLVHPAVAALRERKIRALREGETPPPAVVLEAVKLLESGQYRGCDAVWWIRVTPEVQMKRLIQNRSMGEAAACDRLAQQPPADAKRALAGDLPLVEIENSGTPIELESRVERAWNELLSRMTVS